MLEYFNTERNLKFFGYKVPINKKDKCYVICSLGNHDVITTFHALKRTLKKRGSYRCSKCIANSVEGKAARSLQAKSLWSNPDTAEKIIQKSRNNARSEAGREQRSKQSKAAWNNKEYASFQKKRIIHLFQSEIHRKLVSDRNKKDYELDPEKYIKEKASVLWSQKAKEAHKKALAKPEYREIHRKLAIERFKDPEYKARISAGIENFPRGGKLSTPEKQVQDILEALSIKYIYNKALGPYNFDFYIESKNLYIEVQGEYWHTLPNNERRDKSKYSYLKLAHPDAKIVYIWDYDFNSGNAEFKLKEVLGISKHEFINFDLKSCTLGSPDSKESKAFLNTWHYAQYGKVGKYLLGAFLEGKLIALVKIGPVSRKEVATSEGLTAKECYELDRFCIHPLYQKKNFGSFLISKAVNQFFVMFPEARALVSFADSTFGHDGTIYKASNWTETRKVKPDYIYLSPDGWVLHKKTVYNQAASVHMTEAAYIEKHKYVKVFGKEKTKFMIKNLNQ